MISKSNPFPPDSQPPMAAEVPDGPPVPPGYHVVRLLGRGGMGDVYLVHNEIMDRPEVLKVVQPALLAQSEFLERFQQEVRNAAKLHHPNIVTAYCCLRVGPGLVFAMEYVPGRDLYHLVREKGRLPVLAACHYVRQAALGLQHAHEKGMVHRDVKPHNLMLGKDGNKPVVKVLDFGLAKVVGVGGYDGGLTGSRQMMGTPEYIAPEQILDAAKADIRADVYSLGCTLYYLLAGQSPFAGLSLYETLEAHHFREPTRLSAVRSDVPAGLDAVVAKMMAKDPAHRYQTPAEVAIAVHPFLKGAGAGTKTAPAQAVPYAEAVPTIGPARSATIGTRTVPRAAPATPSPRPPELPGPPPRRPNWAARLIGGALAGLVLAALGLWATGAFRPHAGDAPKTSPPDPKTGPKKVEPEPKTEPKVDPKTEPKVKPKTEPKVEPNAFLPPAALAGRTGPEKARQLARWGGTEGSEAAVAAGLRWLARQQHPDGSWASETTRVDDPIAATALALQAFLGAGHTPGRAGEYGDVVANGLGFLLDLQDKDGWVRQAGRSLYLHARATTVLCEALGLTGDAKYLEPARKAVAFIVANRAADGSWGRTPGQPGDLVHVAAQVEALAAARTSGIAVPAETWRRASKFLDGVATGPAKGRFGYQSPDEFPLPTAMGLYVRAQIDGWGPDHPGMAEGVTYLLKQPAPRKGSFDPTRAYFQSQVVRYYGGDAWHKTWNPVARDLVVSLQAPPGGPAAGSWEMTDFLNAAPAGRLDSTCRAVLILETYYREARPAR